MCFPSQPSPALSYQVSALRQQAAHRWEEEETEKKKYRRLNINIIEGFWEAFLSHVDGIALLNAGQPLFLLLLAPSLFAFSSVSVALTPFHSHHLGASLNLSGILTIRSAAAVHRGLWERTVEI